MSTQKQRKKVTTGVITYCNPFPPSLLVGAATIELRRFAFLVDRYEKPFFVNSTRDATKTNFKIFRIACNTDK